MNRLLLFFLLILLLSCSVKERDRNLTIVVQSNQSYRYDLDKGIMTVYHLRKSPIEIKFHLSDKERTEIIDRYYALGLDRMPEVYHLEDECLVMPELQPVFSKGRAECRKSTAIPGSGPEDPTLQTRDQDGPHVGYLLHLRPNLQHHYTFPPRTSVLV